MRTSGYFFSPNLAAGTFPLVYARECGRLPWCRPRSRDGGRRAVLLALAADTVLCPGSTQPFALRGSPAGGIFSGPGVSGSAATGFVFTPAGELPGARRAYLYSLTNGTCTGTATRRISVAPVPHAGGRVGAGGLRRNPAGAAHACASRWRAFGNRTPAGAGVGVWRWQQSS